MKRLFILAIVALTCAASLSEAGPFRRARRCSGGQCGVQQGAVAPARAAPARVSGFTGLDAIRGTARQCDVTGGCDGR